jgi:hypothetical protein
MPKTGLKAAAPDEGKKKSKAAARAKAKQDEGGEFEVLASVHKEGTGEDKVVYEKGETIQSDKPLDRLFANKFRRLDGKNKKHRDLDETLDTSGRVMNRPKHVRDLEKKIAAKTAKRKTDPSKLDYDEDDQEEDDEIEEDREDDTVEDQIEEDAEERASVSGVEDEEEAKDEAPRKKKKKKSVEAAEEAPRKKKKKSK